MTKIIIDTNGYLRLLLDDIPSQASKVEALINKAKKGKLEILLPAVVIFEIVYILDKYYSCSKTDIIQQVKSLVSTDFIEVESRNIFLSLLDFYASHNLSFIDCFLLFKSKSENADLFTFDQKLASHISDV